MDKAKSWSIPKQLVWDAYKRVKANRGAAGVDDQSIEEFEADLKDNLYKLWNRMSSGSYFGCDRTQDWAAVTCRMVRLPGSWGWTPEGAVRLV